MEGSVPFGELSLENSSVDEEFRSCFGEDEDWQDAEEFSSEAQVEGNEEVSLKIPEGSNEEGFSTFRNSQMLHEDAPDHEEDVVESIIFCDGGEEIVSGCSLLLLEGIDPEHIPACSLRRSDGHVEEVSDCSLRLLEGSEESTLMCSLALYEDHGDDDSECSVILSEGEDESTLNLTRRSCEGQDDDILDSSLRLCECHEEDVSECSLTSLEDDDVVSECSLIFSEDHETDILECPIEKHNKNDDDDDDDGFSVRIFYKGVSFSADGDLGSRTSGIGVLLECPQRIPFHEVQKKMDFFVEEIVAEHLALLDGLLEALKKDYRKVLAFTDSNKVYRILTKSDMVEDPLLIALQERIQELANKFESFGLRQAPRQELMRSLQLARDATGAFSDSIECSTCGEDKPYSQLVEMYCSHHLCFDCICVYVESNFRNAQDHPLKCPYERCTAYISNHFWRSFLPSSFQSLDGELPDIRAQNLFRFNCPFPDCSTVIHPRHCSPSRKPQRNQSDINCIECPGCCRFVCSGCQDPWHSSMRCDMYDNLLLQERNSGDIASNQLVPVSSWRRCQHCGELSELSEGCDRCAHEFCFSCGAEYRSGTQTCQCETLDENSESSSAPSEHETELSRWDCFNLLPGSIDGYTEQEKTQLALIQRFLAGGIGFDSHNPYQSPPRPSDSYLDTFKDLNQLPWLESFISVIGDTYHEDHIYR